jgi:C1A family cysteine protease
MILPSSVSLQKYVAYLPNQESIDCCSSSASLLALEMLLTKNGNSVHLSRLFTYYMARKIQNRLGMKGTSVESVLESLKQFGVPRELLWSFRIGLIDKEPNQLAIADAVNYGILDYRSVSSSNFKESLFNDIPVIVGMRTGQMFWTLSGPMINHRYIPVNNTNNLQSNGHAVTIVGYDDDLVGGSWIIANSLDLRWGDRGFAALPYSCNIDIGESFIITSIK